eukprot:6844102-Prymnesium_polylepis.1
MSSDSDRSCWLRAHSASVAPPSAADCLPRYVSIASSWPMIGPPSTSSSGRWPQGAVSFMLCQAGAPPVPGKRPSQRSPPCSRARAEAEPRAQSGK